MSSHKQVFDTIEGHFANVWTHSLIDYPNVEVPTKYEVGTEDFVRLSISIGRDTAEEIGSEAPSGLFSRGYGIVSISIYTRKGNGDSVLFGYMDKFNDIFDWNKISGISFTEKESTGPYDNTKDGDWRILSCFINFNFSKV